jgi:hypothetical protein
MGHQAGGGEVAHLHGAGLRDEHGHKGQGQHGHLVAHQGDGLCGPEPPERRLDQ